jgi:hypothetical protein
MKLEDSETEGVTKIRRDMAIFGYPALVDISLTYAYTYFYILCL